MKGWRDVIDELTRMFDAQRAEIERLRADIRRMNAANERLRNRCEALSELSDRAESDAKERVQREMAALRAENSRLKGER